MTEKRFKLIGDNNLECLMQDELELPIYDYNNKKRLSLKNTLDLLNEQHEQINTLRESRRELISANNKYRMRETELAQELSTLVDENLKQLDYIQNSINGHIKHQKTELGQKALREIIEDYNEWLLGHKRLQE